MKTYLKIKIKSLAAEARIIRQEEKKWPGPSELRHSLHFHRIYDVRKESRAALLAYGFLRGRAYRQVEPHGELPGWIKARAVELAAKYGPEKDRKLVERRMSEWVELSITAKAA